METGRIKIYVDGDSFEAKPGRNLLHTCLALGFDIPHFCYHPALGSVGACRLCAVKKYRDDNDAKGRIVMSCMEPVTDGLRVSIEDEEAKAFRKAVVESLMINHPHDCPVCDEGGECHLQDMTVMTGHNYRRFSFKKRTFRNQDLGPFINHEMNRCIQCYRCLRYYNDYAGGRDFGVFGSRDHLYFGRFKEGTLENEFSGNLAEVCPTGVFTDKTLKKHYIRKWDMTNSPSICVNCSLGCNTIVSERYGLITRIINRYNGSVNGYFLCDRGRFGYEFINSDERVKEILIRREKDKTPEKGSKEELIKKVRSVLGGSRIIGIGSPRASLESNWALSTLVGKDNFYQGLFEKELNLTGHAMGIISSSAVHTPSLKEIEKADAVLILGEDLTNTAPMAALAVRQAARNKSFEIALKNGIPLWHDDAVRTKADQINSPVFIATVHETKLDDIASSVYRASPQDIARLGFAVASLIDKKAPGIDDLEEKEAELAGIIADQLKGASNPLIISGIHYGSEEIINASANVALALSSSGKKANLSFVFPECNSAGVSLLGGKPLEEAIKKVEDGDADALIVLENDLYHRSDEQLIDRLFDHCKQVIVLDHLTSRTTSRADILLPAGTFAESTGTLVSNEGRAQRSYRAMPVKFPVMDSWRWIKYLSNIIQDKEDESIPDFEDLVSMMSAEVADLTKVKELTILKDSVLLNEKIARQTRRFSGRTAIHSNENVAEQALPPDNDTPLAFTMEGGNEKLPSSLIPFYWTPGWNSVQALYKYVDEPNGSIKGGDPGVRLFDDAEDSSMEYFSQIPVRFKSLSDRLFIAPVHNIFGSEELSSRCNAISTRIQGSTVFLNNGDADKNGVKDGESASVMIDDTQIKVQTIVTEAIPEGIAGLFISISDKKYIRLPGWGRLSK